MWLQGPLVTARASSSLLPQPLLCYNDRMDTSTATVPPPLSPPLKQSDRRVLARCYGYLKPYWRLALGAYVAMLGVSLANMIIPQFIAWTIDQGIGARQQKVLAAAVLGLLGLTLLKGVLTFVQGRLSETAGQSVAYDLRGRIQRKLTELSFSFHNQAETGELLSRAVQDVERIRMITGRATIRMIHSFVMLFVTAGVLLWMNPRLALFAIATMPILAWRALHFGRRARPLSLAIQRQLAVLTTRLEQNLRGARVVKAFAQEDAETERFRSENEKWFATSVQSVRLSSVNQPLMHLIANLGSVFIRGTAVCSSAAATSPSASLSLSPPTWGSLCSPFAPSGRPSPCWRWASQPANASLRSSTPCPTSTTRLMHATCRPSRGASHSTTRRSPTARAPWCATSTWTPCPAR